MGAILTISKIDKHFDIVHALDEVSFVIEEGEIKGLIGENGSGKSTVSSIIAGAQKADNGEMTMEGKPYQPKNVLEAQQCGIAMVVQEQGTVSGLTVAENLYMGKEKRFSHGGIINLKKIAAETRRQLDRLGLNHVMPQFPAGLYNGEDRKLMEIARALIDDPKLLIIDETTTALSQKGRELLYQLMRDLAKAGKAVLFISHDLDEIMDVCTSISVLRDGHYVAELKREEFDADTIRNLMVGREMAGDYYRTDFDPGFEEEIALEFQNVCNSRVKDFSFQLHKGEILGISGLSESGIRDVGKIAFGVEKVTKGKVLIHGNHKVVSARDSIANGVGYASKNRDEESLVLDDSVRTNLVMTIYDRIRKGGFILPGNEKKEAQKLVELLKLKCSGLGQEVRTLSGGNKQKVVFGKWIGADSQILILDCPTRGIDIGVKQAMYQLMYTLKKQGRALLLISEELPELIGMCDRIITVKDGSVSGEFVRRADLTEHEIIQHII